MESYLIKRRGEALIADCELCVMETTRLIFRPGGFDMKWYLIKRRGEALIEVCEL